MYLIGLTGGISTGKSTGETIFWRSNFIEKTRTKRTRHAQQLLAFSVRVG
jgi:hypothetical protein